MVASNNVAPAAGTTVWQVNQVASLAVGDRVNVAYLYDSTKYVQGTVTAVDSQGSTVTVNADTSNGPSGTTLTPWAMTILAIAVSPVLTTCVEFATDAVNSCFTNGGCPPPPWPVQWNLTLSTICNPGNQFLQNPGYFNSSNWTQPWGIIAVDWSVAQSIWQRYPPNGNPGDTDLAVTTENCAIIKQHFPETRCFIYHDGTAAQVNLETDRVPMYNLTYSGYFLKEAGTDTIYNYYGVPGDQYMWDFRNASASTYFINAILQSLNNDSVDGTYIDDQLSTVADVFPEFEGNPSVPTSLTTYITGINTTEAITPFLYCKDQAQVRLLPALITNGKYTWAAFSQQDSLAPGVPQFGCANFMAAKCGAQWQTDATTVSTFTFDANHPIQSTAGFLILRGPYSWLGNGWLRGDVQWDPVFLAQVGEPVGSCVQTSSGVFTRQWTYGTTTLNCNTWSATIEAQSGTIQN